MQQQNQLNHHPADSSPEHSSSTSQSFGSNQHRLSLIQSGAGPAQQPAEVDGLSQSLSQAFMGYYSQFNGPQQLVASTQESVQQSYTPESDGTISFAGGSIGPFLGEWQGVPRNKLIAERLSALQQSQLQDTDIHMHGGGAVLHIGDTSFTLSAADVAAQNIENAPHPAWTAAVMTLSALGAAVPEKSLRQIRGELAVRQARLTYQEGQEKYGDDSWETKGSNKGPLITPLKEANRASSRDNYEWCGMYVGHAFAKAGIRREILRSLVFWSGYRLHLFFTKGEDVSRKKIGSFWQPHSNLRLDFSNDERRKEAFDAYAPEPGDVVLFRKDYGHVAIVDSYDSETGTLQILEGNSGNRVQATAFGTGDDQITFIGRFNDSDFGNDVDEGLLQKSTPDVDHDDERNGRTSWNRFDMPYT